MQLKRSGTKPPPYFLCDTATYVLGIDKEGEITARSKAYFTAFSSYNKDILSHIDCLEARAVINFLDNWDIESALSNPIVQDALPYDLGKGNLAFYITDTNTWVLDSPKIQTGWDMYYQESSTQGCLGVCLVTGKDAPIARIHNSIKKLRTSSRSPNGWTLVGFDKGSPAFSSYGKEQGYNAPTSEYVAFAYTTALNHLLDDQEHVYQLGDTTVVCWARGGGDAYQSYLENINTGASEVLSTVNGGKYGYMQGTSMACPHVSGVAALGLSYALQLGKTFTQNEFTTLLLTSVNDINQYCTGTKQYFTDKGSLATLDLSQYKKGMGTGYIDAYQVLMNVRGITCIPIPVGSQYTLNLQPYLGGGNLDLKITEISISAEDMNRLGISANPTIFANQIILKCTKPGSAVVRIKLLAGNGNNSGMNGMPITKEFAFIAREVHSQNGGWL